MATDWKTYRIEDVAASMGDAPFGSLLKNIDYTDGGALVVQGKNIQGRTCDWTDRRYVSHEKYGRLSRSHCFLGDLIFPKVGTIGKVGRLTSCPGVNEYVLSTNTMRFRGDESIASTDYVYYFFKWPKTVQLIHALNSKSVQPVFNFTTLKNFEIVLPPLAEQKAIAAVLGALDDKIELNRRMNATLEAMARALFQSWFVDFDPVRAKLDGRTPTGLDPATSTLFPDEFEDSELGPIPKGWHVRKVSDNFDLTMGQSPPGETYNETGAGLPFYQGRADFGFRFPTRRVFCTAPTRHAKTGDTLVSVRAPVGDINMADEECCVGRGVAAVRHKTGASSFTYYTMENFASDFARFEAEGTVFGSINKQDFSELPLIVASPELIDAYERLASPLDRQIKVFEHQSRTLAAARDALLPKLITGALRVYA